MFRLSALLGLSVRPFGYGRVRPVEGVRVGGMMSGVDLGLWGKRRGLPGPYPLVCHLLDAAAAVGVLWDLYLAPGLRRRLVDALGDSEEEARGMVMLWAGLHDIGKAMPCF